MVSNLLVVLCGNHDAQPSLTQEAYTNDGWLKVKNKFHYDCLLNYMLLSHHGQKMILISQWTNRIFINGMRETKEERRQIRLWNHWWTFRNWYWIGKRMDEIRPSLFLLFIQIVKADCFIAQTKKKLSLWLRENHADFIITVTWFAKCESKEFRNLFRTPSFAAFF